MLQTHNRNRREQLPTIPQEPTIFTESDSNKTVHPPPCFQKQKSTKKSDAVSSLSNKMNKYLEALKLIDTNPSPSLSLAASSNKSQNKKNEPNSSKNSSMLARRRSCGFSEESGFQGGVDLSRELENQKRKIPLQTATISPDLRSRVKRRSSLEIPQNNSFSADNHKNAGGRADETKNLDKSALINEKLLLTVEEEIDAKSQKVGLLDKEIQNFSLQLEHIEAKANESYQVEYKSIEIEYQKIVAYQKEIQKKLTDIIREQGTNYEHKAILKEDLNSKLLQRAELVAQREELDGILESFEVEEHSRQQQLQKSENYLQQLSQPKMRNEKSAKFFGGVESAQSDEEKRRMQGQRLIAELNSISYSIKQNIKTVDEDILPTLKVVLRKIDENKEIIACLKREQIDLLEKEEQICLRADYAKSKKKAMLENAQQQLIRMHGKGLSEIKELRRQLCAQIRQLQEYYSHLQHGLEDKGAQSSIITNSKRSIEDRLKQFQAELSRRGNILVLQEPENSTQSPRNESLNISDLRGTTSVFEEEAMNAAEKENLIFLSNEDNLSRLQAQRPVNTVNAKRNQEQERNPLSSLIQNRITDPLPKANIHQEKTQKSVGTASYIRNDQLTQANMKKKQLPPTPQNKPTNERTRQNFHSVVERNAPFECSISIQELELESKLQEELRSIDAKLTQKRRNSLSANLSTDETRLSQSQQMENSLCMAKSPQNSNLNQNTKTNKSNKLDQTLNSLDLNSFSLFKERPQSSKHISFNLNNSAADFGAEPFNLRLNSSLVSIDASFIEPHHDYQPKPAKYNKNVPQKTIAKIESLKKSLVDTQFYDQIRSLLQSTTIFKSTSNHQNLKWSALGSLNSDEFVPEEYGYALRTIQLSKELDKLEIRQVFRPGVESVIFIDNLLRPLIPEITNTMLKLQNSSGNNHIQNETLDRRLEVDHLQRKTNGRNGVASHRTQFFPFSIIFVKGGKIDLIAPSYQVFQNWIQGLNMLIKNKRNLEQLKLNLIF